MKRFPVWLRLLLILAAAAGVLLFFYHCPFRFFFGVSCMGCGMTRALFAAVFANFDTAFYYHPMLPMLLPAALYIGLRMFCGMEVPSKRQNVYILLLAGFLILTYIVRMVAQDPVLQPDFDASLIARVLAFLQSIQN